jgi:ATP-dependent Clp protease adaptor protein ClpS
LGIEGLGIEGLGIEALGIEASGAQTPGGGDDGGRSGTAIVTKTKPRTKKPNLYRVLLLNDDYTPMDFVVTVLQSFFAMDLDKATQVMLHVHTRGRGVCGVFTREVAESKVAQVNEFSRMNQHPLLCTMEKT